MASQGRKSIVSITDRLEKQPHRFSFYQAVRLLLHRSSLRANATSQSNSKRRIGTLTNLSDEPVRFRTLTSLSFPPADITDLRLAKSDDDGISAANEKAPVAEVEVAFWGLIGPAGALPNHYTQLAIDRAHHKDYAIRDFLDGFSHRQLSFFYRAWEKYFPAAGYENAVVCGTPESDLVRESLLSLVGRGHRSVRDRFEVADDALVYYGGHFSASPTANSLEAMVADFLGLPAKVDSLFGQWLELPVPERTRIGMLDGHCKMGFDTVVGTRTWDPGSKFRLRIGPVGLDEFESLLPTAPTLPRICQFIRSYVGMEYDFDLQVILRREEIPFCKLSDTTSDEPPAERDDQPDVRPYLGWNTWLCSKMPTEDSEDAVFHHDGSPTR
ncbi:MAG: type VI secretion system baseplate subunit TssG [Planctomycetota bacterium]